MPFERWLLDTNILLRLVWLNDEHSEPVEQALRKLAGQNALLYMTLQNASEYWNVCTRLNTERGGLALSPDEAQRGLELIETRVALLADTADVYRRWRELVSTHQVRGVQAHDAKLVASMMTHNVKNILTLNETHFARYAGIHATSPEYMA